MLTRSDLRSWSATAFLRRQGLPRPVVFLVMIMDHPTEIDGDNKSGPTSTSGPIPLQTANNAWDSYDTVFMNAKAGMDGVDKKKVQKVVYDMSKGSRYFNNEQRKEAEVQQRIQRMNARAASLTPLQLAEHEKATDLKIAELEAARDLSRVWVHVDMDAFYAAVETLVNPSLAGKPMAVGGMSMICTANYEARKFGVRAAMPGFIARKLCPQLIFVRPDFKKYSHYSELSRQVFKEYDPDFVARSLDEAYLDITNSCLSRNMSGAEVVEELRSKVHSVTGLTCSAGVGPNRMVAKVCSDINKPNGQFVIRHERGAVMAFVSSLPIRKVNGIGKVTERLLKDVLAISTCADLLSKRAIISALFSQISTEFFLAVSLGIGGSETPEKEHRKSLSNERTFAAISEEHLLFQKLEELVELLADDMQKEELQGRTLTLKLKETGFEVRSRAVTLPSFISTKPEIWEHAYKLLKAELPLSLRLMGLRISHFKDEKPDPSQRTLTSFLTQSGASKIGHTQQVSDDSNNIPFNSSENAHDLAPEPVVKGKQFPSQGYSHGKNIQESSHDVKEGPLGSRMRQSVMPQLASSHISPWKETLSSPASATNTIIEEPGAVQSRPEDLGQNQTGLTTRPETDVGIETSAPSVALRGMGTQGGMRFRVGQEEDIQPTTIIGVQRDASSSAVSCGEASFHTDMHEKRMAMSRREDMDPSSSNMDKDMDSPLGSCSRRISSGFQQEAAGLGQVRDPTISLETAEPSWQALQSGYDSAHGQIWVNGNRCALCDMAVDDSLPAARQEHEDFHFAVWLQQQAEESGGLQKFTSTTPPPKKTASPAVVRESSKRKVSGSKVHHTPPKRSSHLPLEAFFSKAK